MNSHLQGPRRGIHWHHGWLPAWLAAGLLVLFSWLPGGLAGTYNTPLAPGLNLVGIHLRQTPTTINQVLGLGFPDGTVAYFWNPGSQSFSVETMSLGAWIPGTTSMPEGTGVFLRDPSAPGTLTLSGVAGAGPTIAYDPVTGAFDNRWYLLANAQPGAETAPGSYAQITGHPEPGNRVIEWARFNRTTQKYEFAIWTPAGGWLPAVPSLPVGEAVFLRATPLPTTSPCLTQVEVGCDAGGSFLLLQFDQPVGAPTALSAASYSFSPATITPGVIQYLDATSASVPNTRKVKIYASGLPASGLVTVTAAGVQNYAGLTPAVGCQSAQVQMSLIPVNALANCNSVTSNQLADTIEIQFNGALDPSIALFPGSYSVNGGSINVQNVTLNPDRTRVTLTLQQPLPPGVNLNLVDLIGLFDDCGRTLVTPVVTVPVTSTCNELITGRVFQDGNADCAFNGTDYGLPLHVVRAVAGGTTYSAPCMPDGTYRLRVPSGATYTVSVVPVAGWSAAGACASSYNFAVSGGGTYTADFAMQYTGTPVQDLSTFIHYRYIKDPIDGRPFSSPCCGFPMTIVVDYRNVGTVPISGANLQVNIPALTAPLASGPNLADYVFDQSIPALAPPTLFGSVVDYVLPSLNPGQFGRVEISLRLNCAIGASATLSTTSDLTPTAGDATPANNHATLSDTTRCAHDPNDKTVSPRGCGPEGFVPQNTEFTYLVRFQNVGSGPARRVVIEDRLDPDLAINTLQVLAASHPYTFTLNTGTRLATWTFNDIQLPGAAYDEPGSHGYVRFKVRHATGRPAGTVITNRAAIYFDINPPVLTSTTTNTLSTSTLPSATFTAAPNPAGVGQPVAFTYTGGSAGVTFAWDFGPTAIPSTSTLPNPVVTYTTAGAKLPTLVVAQGGCVSEPFVAGLNITNPPCTDQVILTCPRSLSLCTNNGPCAPMPDVTPLLTASSPCQPVSFTQSIPVGSPVCANAGPAGVLVTATDACGCRRECFIPFVFEGCCTPPPANMTLWLTFDEKVGNVALNSRGGNNGLLLDDPAPATTGTGPLHDASGYVLRSLLFDGVNDVVRVPSYPGINVGTADFSVDAWIKPAPGLVNGVIVEKMSHAGGSPIGWSLRLAANRLVLELQRPGFGQTICSGPCPGFLLSSNWHHVAITVCRDLTNGGGFYVDGARVATFDPTPWAGASLSTTTPLAVGGSSVTPMVNPAFRGNIDEVEMFCRCLGSNEVRSLWAAGPSGKCKVSCDMPWDYVVCSNAPGTVVNAAATVENHSAAPVTITYTWSGLSACSAPGPVTFNPPSGTITIPANGSASVPVAVTVPPMTSGQVSCFQLTVTVSGSGERFSCMSSLWATSGLCAGRPTGATLTNFPGLTNALNWRITNLTASAQSLDWQVLAFDTAMRPASNVIVTPSAGSIVVPAGGVTVLPGGCYLTDCDFRRPYNLVLTVGTQTLDSVMLVQLQPATVATSQPDLVVSASWLGSTGVVTVVNAGNAAASNVVLNFTLTGGVQPLSPDCSSPSPGEEGLFESTCVIGTLPPNGSATRGFQSVFPQGFSRLVAAEAITTTPESNPDNNSAEAWSSGRPNMLLEPESLSLGTNGLDGALFVLAGGDGVRLQWYRDGAALPGETNDELVVSTAGAYQAIAINASGSTTSAVANVTILPLPSVDPGGILAGFGQNFLPRGDDLSSGFIPFCFTNAICFCGSNYTGLYVNNNGNVTFDSPFGGYSPTPLCNLNRAILAPFWADVDTRLPRSGRVSWGCGTRWIPGAGFRPVFVATWKRVGYYSQHANKRDTFQLVIVDRSDRGTGDWDVQYRYRKLRWDTGDASGGSNGQCANTPAYPARAGYASRNLCCLELPGSGQCGALLDGNAATGLTQHHIGAGPNGIYTWEFIQCSPRPQAPGCEPTNNLPNVLGRGDDTFEGPISLCFPNPICFCGRYYSTLYINNNGSVTFGGGLATFTPGSFASVGRPIIAPFWADVDTRPANGGAVRYGCVSRYVEGAGYRPTFVVAWDNVGYYQQHTDKRNSFQLHITDRSDRAPGDFDFKFCYDRISWETGDASGGSNGFGGFPAYAGFGDGTACLYALAGSGVSGAFLDSNLASGLIHNRLNSTEDGVYCFSMTNCVPNVASNRPPVVRTRGATNCIDALCCALVPLASAGTADPDGDALTYSWKEGTTLLSTAPSPTVQLCGPGLHVLTLTVNDGHGHVVTTTANVLLRDCTAPVITGCPTNISVTTCSTNIPDLRGLVTATDSCSPPGSLVVTQTPAPLTPVGPGVYPISIRVCDPAGNCATCLVLYEVHAVRLPSSRPVFNTGVNAAGAPLAPGASDPHFTLVSRPPTGPGTAIAVAQNTAWNAPGTGSSWIGTRTTWEDQPGIYVFRTYITNDCDLREMEVEGRWAADDAVELWIDGQLRASRTPPPSAAIGWQNFSVSGLGYGVHVADFVVSNICCPVGLRVEWTNYCACPTNGPCLPPIIVLPPRDGMVPVPVPVGYASTLTVTAGGSNPLFYQWYTGGTALQDNANVSGAHTATLTLRPPGLTNSYYVVISNDCGSVTSRVARFYGGPVILQSGFNAQRGFTVTTATIPGLTYRLVRADRFGAASEADWKTVAEATATGETTVLVDEEPHPVMRIYRVASPPPPSLEE